MDRGTWWAIVYGVAKRWTYLRDQHLKGLVIDRKNKTKQNKNHLVNSCSAKVHNTTFFFSQVLLQKNIFKNYISELLKYI